MRVRLDQLRHMEPYWNFCTDVDQNISFGYGEFFSDRDPKPLGRLENRLRLTSSPFYDGLKVHLFRHLDQLTIG